MNYLFIIMFSLGMLALRMYFKRIGYQDPYEDKPTRLSIWLLCTPPFIAVFASAFVVDHHWAQQYPTEIGILLFAVNLGCLFIKRFSSKRYLLLFYYGFLVGLLFSIGYLWPDMPENLRKTIVFLSLFGSSFPYGIALQRVFTSFE